MHNFCFDIDKPSPLVYISDVTKFQQRNQKMVKIVSPSFEVITPLDGDYILKHLERCARNCYKSEDKITSDSAQKMIKKLIDLGHEAMIEHFSITVKMTTDVGAYKDLTRHRHASFAIESTRFCNYSKGKYGNELTFMKPSNIEEGSELYNIWLQAMTDAEKHYLDMATRGATVDQLRMLLPHSTKADVFMTANLREWRHIFKLRCAPATHPSIQHIMKMILNEFRAHIPVLFDDIPYGWEEEKESSLNMAAE